MPGDDGILKGRVLRAGQHIWSPNPRIEADIAMGVIAETMQLANLGRGALQHLKFLIGILKHHGTLRVPEAKLGAAGEAYGSELEGDEVVLTFRPAPETDPGEVAAQAIGAALEAIKAVPAGEGGEKFLAAARAFEAAARDTAGLRGP